MLEWNALTLFIYVLMRMTGFVLFNPFFGRSGIPGLFKSGFILLLSATVYSLYPRVAPVPGTLLEFFLKLLLELGVGAFISLLMRFVFFIPEQAGEIVDTQMGLSMAKNYDPGSQSSATVTANLLRIMMILLFFVSNGHLTLLRIMISSGELVPYGQASFGDLALNRGVEVFVECIVLAIKMSFPILAAEVLGQVGMGVLMKVIPQINVFAINIELKVIIGLVMLMLLLAPISDYMLEIESKMLRELELALQLMT